ncbi:hypothetical protein [Streptomyces sp. NPDC055912]|uniref:hypothetical protein n=1 Tax=unclassified Streptomyces TaxID=2593676 RepID=UPI0035DE42F4
MDLQGIGAIAAAAIAAIGIPSALVIGRWQTRAALQAAEATARAGLAQAESTYRAALDAVRAQGQDAYSQWRRSIRRDAYASLLMTSHQLVTATSKITELPFGERIINDERLSQRAAVAEASTALRGAHLAVMLEGPEKVAAACSEHVAACLRMMDSQLRKEGREFAWHCILTAEPSSPDPADLLTAFRDALLRARNLIIARDSRTRTLTAELADTSQPSQIRDLCNAAMANAHGLPPELRSHAYLCVGDLTRDSNNADYEHSSVHIAALNQSRESFLAAARDVLDDEPNALII